MNLYSFDVTLSAALFVRAETEEEAQKIAQERAGAIMPFDAGHPDVFKGKLLSKKRPQASFPGAAVVITVDPDATLISKG